MEKDIKFVVRKSSGDCVPSDVAWKRHYDPIGQNIITLRKCHRALAKRLKKQKKSGKACKKIRTAKAQSLLKKQKVSQLPELPDYPDSFPFHGQVPIRKRRHRNKIKMSGVLTENAVKKQRLLFVKRILAQTGFSVETMDFENTVLNCLADIADEFLKRFVDAMRLNKSNGAYPHSEDLLHLVETTLRNVGFAGISGLQTYYNEQVLKKHDILFRKCQKMLDSYKTLAAQQLKDGSMEDSHSVPAETDTKILESDQSVLQVNSSPKITLSIKSKTKMSSKNCHQQIREDSQAVPAESKTEVFESDQSVVQINHYPSPKVTLSIKSKAKVSSKNCHQQIREDSHSVPAETDTKVLERDQSVVQVNPSPKVTLSIKSKTKVSSKDCHQQISEDSLMMSSEDHEKLFNSHELLTQVSHPPPPDVPLPSESVASPMPKISSNGVRKVRFSTTSRKRYLCEYCERDYASMSSLTRHLSSAHNIATPKKKRKT